MEVERRVQLVGPRVGSLCLGGLHPRLAHERAIRRVGVGDPTPLAPDLVHGWLVPRGASLVATEHLLVFRIRAVGVAVGLDQAVCDVDAEPVDPEVEPEAQSPLEVRVDLGVAPVDIWLR